MSDVTLDLTCSCGGSMHYVGTVPSGHRAAFLAAHERCRPAVVEAAPSLKLVGLDGSAVQRSLLKLKRRNGGSPLGLA